MAIDPVLLLARHRTIKLSADLEVQLALTKGSAPTLAIVGMLKEDAANALAALALSNDPKEIAGCQIRVRVYDAFVQTTMKLIAEGKQLDQEISYAEREEFLDILEQSPEGRQTAIDLGLISDNPQQDG